MFQYALYRKLSISGRDVKLDMSYYEREINRDKLGLWIFDLNLVKASRSQIEYIKNENLILKVRNQILGRKTKVISEVGKLDLSYNQEVLKVKRGYLDGYWQTDKYFRDIKDILLADFRFPKSNNPKNSYILSDIWNCDSISIHVRRGDYVGSSHFPVIALEYYIQAIAYFQSKIVSPKFFVFSDDIEWSKANIRANNTVFVDWNNNVENYMDLYLMSQCKHNIISNSSFSWWAAYLNTNAGKEVLSPHIWFNYIATPDVVCSDWKVLNYELKSINIHADSQFVHLE